MIDLKLNSGDAAETPYSVEHEVSALRESVKGRIFLAVLGTVFLLLSLVVRSFSGTMPIEARYIMSIASMTWLVISVGVIVYGLVSASSLNQKAKELASENSQD